MNFKNNKGFTIVELLVVIIVIGILAAIGVVSYNGVTQKSRDAKNKSSARQIVDAVSAYQSENGQWPGGPDGVKTALQSYDSVDVSEDTINNITNATPDASNQDRIQVVTCTAQGIKATYYTSQGNKSISAGNCK